MADTNRKILRRTVACMMIFSILLTDLSVQVIKAATYEEDPSYILVDEVSLESDPNEDLFVDSVEDSFNDLNGETSEDDAFEGIIEEEAASSEEENPFEETLPEDEFVVFAQEEQSEAFYEDSMAFSSESLTFEALSGYPGWRCTYDNDGTMFVEVGYSYSNVQKPIQEIFGFSDEIAADVAVLIVSDNPAYGVEYGQKNFTNGSELPNLERVEIRGKISNYIQTENNTIKNISIETDGAVCLHITNCSMLEKTAAAAEPGRIIMLASDAFRNCTGLKTVDFDCKVDVSGYYQFAGCEALTDVHFASLGSFNAGGTFYRCSALKSFIADEMDAPALLNGCTFYYCENLETLAMPAGIEGIGKGEFTGCRMLTAIPDLTPLDRITTTTSTQFVPLLDSDNNDLGIFAGCESLKEVCFSPELDLTRLSNFSGDYANFTGVFKFTDCSSLERVVLPGNIGSAISYGMFKGCGKLESLEGINKQTALTRVEAAAFEGCMSLETLPLPATISSLKSVPEGLKIFDLPTNVNSDNSSLFENCYTLEKLTIPETITACYISCNYDIQAVYLHGFPKGFSGNLGNGVIDNLYIEEGITQIPYGQFENSSVRCVHLPASLQKIGGFAFSSDGSLEEVTMGDGVTDIGSYAFYKCSELKKVTLSRNLENLENQVFQDCTALSDIVLPETLKKIGTSAFDGCTALTEITIPGNVEEFPSSFTNTGLTKVYIEEGVSVIPNSCFAGSAKLSEVSLPGSITTVADKAFADTGLESFQLYAEGDVSFCSGSFEGSDLNSMVFSGDNLMITKTGGRTTTINADEIVFDTDSFSMSGGELIEPGNRKIYFRRGSIDFGNGGFAYPYYSSQDGEANLLQVYFGSNVESITGSISKSNSAVIEIHGAKGSCAETFADSRGYTFVEVTEDAPIPWDALSGSFVYRIENEEAIVTGYKGNKKEVEIPATLEGYPVTAIEKGVSALGTNRKKFNRISIPASVRSIDVGFAAWSRELREISVDSANPYFCADGEALYDIDATTLLLVVPALTDYVIPQQITAIGERAFAWCKVKEVTVSDNVTQIGAYAFSGITEKVELGRGVTEIAENLFRGGNLNELLIHGELTKIGEDAFHSCIYLKELEFPETVTAIGSGAFYGCTRLEKVNIPSGVLSIGGSTFQNCKALKQLDFPGDIVIMGNNMFTGSGLEILTYAEDRKNQAATRLVNCLKGMDVELYVPAESSLLEKLTEEGESGRLYEKTYSGVMIGHYLVGIKVEVEKYFAHFLPRQVETGISLIFTRPVNITDHAVLSFAREDDIQTTWDTVPTMQEDVETLVLNSTGKAPVLPASSKMCLVLKEGSIEVEGEYSAEWTSRNVWTKETIRDLWSGKNLTIPIEDHVYTTLFGRNLGLDVKTLIDGKGGICYGMVMALLYVMEGKLSAENFPREGLYYTSPDLIMQKDFGIPYYELWQIMMLAQLMQGPDEELKQNENQMQDLYDAVHAMLTNQGPPVMLRPVLTIGKHALLPLKEIQDEGGEYVTIICYDCNHPSDTPELKIYRSGDWTYGSETPLEDKKISYTYLVDEALEMVRAYAEGRKYDVGTKQYLLIKARAEGNYVREEMGLGKPVGSVPSDGLQIYGYDGSRGALELPDVPAGTEVKLTGQYSSVSAATDNTDSDITLLSGSHAGDESRIVIDGQAEDTCSMTIQYEDENRPDTIMLTGIMKGKAVIEETDGGLLVGGISQVTIDAEKENQKVKKTYNLPENEAGGNNEERYFLRILPQDGSFEVALYEDIDHDGIADTVILSEEEKNAQEGGNEGESESGTDSTSQNGAGLNYTNQNFKVPAEQITITKKPIIKKPSATKKKITVKWKHFKHTSKKTKAIWKKIKKVQMQCATDKAFKNIVKSTMVGKSKTKATIKGLKKSTTYYVRVRYYDGTGYSGWSKVKKIKTKKR